MGGMYDVALISSCPLKYFPWFLACLEGLVKAILLTSWSLWSVCSLPCHHHAHFQQPSILFQMCLLTVLLDVRLNRKLSTISFHRPYLRISATARSWDNPFLVTHNDDKHLQQQADKTINEGNTDRPPIISKQETGHFNHHHYPHPQKRAYSSFLRVVALCHHHHHPPTLKMSNVLIFEGVYSVPPPPPLSYLENEHPHLFSMVFISFMYIYNSLMYIIIN